jgi:hypothetical protein
LVFKEGKRGPILVKGGVHLEYSEREDVYKLKVANEVESLYHHHYHHKMVGFTLGICKGT